MPVARVVSQSHVAFRREPSRRSPLLRNVSRPFETFRDAHLSASIPGASTVTIQKTRRVDPKVDHPTRRDLVRSLSLDDAVEAALAAG